MNDESTTVADLRRMVSEFVEQRDWEQFHAPKNLVMALSVEAAELMEHFQWLTIQQSRDMSSNRAKLQAVGEELADVVCYALALANELDLDLSSTLHGKMEKNAVKYPAAEYRGRYEKPSRQADE